MSLIVAARFDTFDAAEAAAQDLFETGIVVEDDVNIFFVNPPGMHDRHPLGGDTAADPGVKHSAEGAGLAAGVLGTVGAVIGALLSGILHWPWIVVAIAAGVGAYGGSLWGAMLRSKKLDTRHAPGHVQPIRHGGVLLAVHATAQSESEVAIILRDAGGQDVEKATGRWQGGRWADFDALKPPVLSDRVASHPKVAREGV